MAAFQGLKSVSSGCAFAVLTGFLSSGVDFAGKKALAAEKESSEAARRDGFKPNASEDGRLVLACTPQFDGLECFETIVRIGKHARKSVKVADTESWNLSVAPQFDGLECFETIVSIGKYPRSVTQPMATEKSVPKNRGLAIAPQFDGLHCFETFVSKK